ncbi:MAG: hypothetical protein AAFR38_11650 [Planctomycetota bacterium]
MQTVLAQSANAQATQQTLLWSGVLIVIVLAGFVALLLLKRWLDFGGKTAGDSGGFLDELRALRDAGKITEDEYEQTRLRVLSKSSGIPVEELRRRAIEKAGGLVAEPGFDLAGRPLPGGSGSSSGGPGDGHDRTTPPEQEGAGDEERSA